MTEGKRARRTIEPTPSDPIRSKEKLRSALGSTRQGQMFGEISR